MKVNSRKTKRNLGIKTLISTIITIVFLVMVMFSAPEIMIAQNSAEALVQKDDSWYLRAGKTELRFSTSKIPGLCSFTDTSNKIAWVDTEYSWILEYSTGDDPAPAQFTKATMLKDAETTFNNLGSDGWIICVTGKLGECKVIVDYKLSADGNWLDETITVVNNSTHPIRITEWDFGPGKRTIAATVPLIDMTKFRAAAIPWRRQILDPQTVQDYDFKTLPNLKSKGGADFEPGTGWWRLQPLSNDLGSEAWALLNNGSGLLVMKYAPSMLEYSVLRYDVTRQGPMIPGARSEYVEDLLFGGSKRYHQDPSPGLIQAGEKYKFGVTRYQLFDGDWKEAFALFKTTMNGWGNGLPENYLGYLHWNEHFENKGRWPNMHYCMDFINDQIKKALAYHCETFYMDPGWDTEFGTAIWNEKLLGPLKEFTKRLSNEYGLKVGIHVPLAGWTETESYPKSTFRMDENGKRHDENSYNSLCGGSKPYLQTKAERLKVLAKGGIQFMMFDGSWYTGPCYDPDHGHPIPYTRDDHLMACKWLAQEVHKINPDIKIEMHDFMTLFPYCPVYIGYRHGGGFDEIWAYEMMSESPAEYVKNKLALCLYYYNLAYDIPLYMHINLGRDNENALGLWWFASTCRHLGIGNTHPYPKVVKVQQDAMKLYRSLERYYVNGKFVGLNEYAHLHTLPERSGGVLNLFNVDDKDTVVSCQIPAKELKVNPGTKLLPVSDTKFVWKDSTLFVECILKALSPKVLIFRPEGMK